MESFFKTIEGDFTVGERIKIKAGGMRFQPTVLAFDPPKEFRWIGHLWMKGLFDGEHIFQILDNQDGTVTFNHEEQFSGILVGLMAKKLDTEVKQNFEQMNRKLKELAEKKHNIASIPETK